MFWRYSSHALSPTSVTDYGHLAPSLSDKAHEPLSRKVFPSRYSRTSREILQIGFRDTDLTTISQIHQKRQDLQAFIIQASDRLVCVGLLEGIEKLLLERRLRTIHVSGECLIIRGKIIDGLLVGDNDRFLSFRRETVSDSIVIHPKNQPVVSRNEICISL